ncbi:long-chain-fatty-acyl-CoA reductase [Mangrovimicrobium sediminis]|uniref:Long-chain-fatty-acyl-CoA reductase n=1 Tax=Mangrovimicrobium sediminis TaxID=2562682 RepID=A0A4Z0LZU7_9GAMM|nr:acyl-CoA reductase [Haliea sp. SAOS-164]TGD72575.1 long-chain-fatty-acyl-CoA reductase [Haliea sp. SAOS-164]
MTDSLKPISYAIIRGKIHHDNLVSFGGRGGDLEFYAPDPQTIIDELPIRSPSDMADMYELSLDDVIDYLEELGTHLDFRTNDYLREAAEYSYQTAPTTPPIIDGFYATLPLMFNRERILQWVDNSVGREYLEGWVEKRINGSDFNVRAYGSRALHIVAGNGPTLGALTVLRGAVTRSDTVIKVPSNDPFTTGAIVRTMVDVAPDHPITKHVSVAYWRGGDEAFEKKLYQPHNLEKIVAWGGFSSVKHVTKYIQPGLELISLDPKHSASFVGEGGLESEEQIIEVGKRIACDVGVGNQVGCANCRTVYVMGGESDEAIERLVKLGHAVYDGMLGLPEDMSTRPKRYDPELKSHVDACRLSDDFYEVIGGQQGEGAVIVSKTSDPVDFSAYLADRTVNLVPIDTLEDFLDAVDCSTQTVGVYPPQWVDEVRHKGALHGGQRFVELGYNLNGPGLIGPQDGIEPVRRMVKWIINEKPTAAMTPMWEFKPGETHLVA